MCLSSGIIYKIYKSITEGISMNQLKKLFYNVPLGMRSAPTYMVF